MIYSRGHEIWQRHWHQFFLLEIATPPVLCKQVRSMKKTTSDSVNLWTRANICVGIILSCLPTDEGDGIVSLLLHFRSQMWQIAPPLRARWCPIAKTASRTQGRAHESMWRRWSTSPSLPCQSPLLSMVISDPIHVYKMVTILKSKLTEDEFGSKPIREA